MSKKKTNILSEANEIVNNRSEEKSRQYGPFEEGMRRAAMIFNGITQGLNHDDRSVLKGRDVRLPLRIGDGRDIPLWTVNGHQVEWLEIF